MVVPRQRPAELRRSVPQDADALATVWLTSFKATYAFPPAHSDDEIRAWIRDHVAISEDTWVAVAPGGEVVGFMALDAQGIDQLYLLPAWTGRGLGSRFVDLAKRLRPGGLALYTFQANTRARTFYERHGFTVDRLGDGSDNDEHEPDVRYVWRPGAVGAG